VHFGLARTATSVYAVCVANVALRVATAVHARRTRPSEEEDGEAEIGAAGAVELKPAAVVSAATRTEFFSRAQQLSGESAIARLFHTVWQAVVSEVGTDVDAKATSFFRSVDSTAFGSLLARIRARCEEGTASCCATHALVAAVVPLFAAQSASGAAAGGIEVDGALVREMIDEVLDTIEGCVPSTRANRCGQRSPCSLRVAPASPRPAWER